MTKNEVATTKEQLPANIGELGGIEDNFKGISRITLPFVKAEWAAKLFNMPDGEPKKTFDGIILRVEPYKTFWKLKMGAEGATPNAAPDCFSFGLGGLLQPPQGEHVQSATCIKCKWNAFESATNEKGEKTRGKRCGDRLRFFVYTEGSVLPVQLQIPPTSLFAWSTYVTNVLKVHYSGVITRFSVDADKKGKAPGVLHLETVRGITEDEVKMVLSLRSKFHETFGSAPVEEEAAPSEVEETLKKAGV